MRHTKSGMHTEALMAGAVRCVLAGAVPRSSVCPFPAAERGARPNRADAGKANQQLRYWSHGAPWPTMTTRTTHMVLHRQARLASSAHGLCLLRCLHETLKETMREGARAAWRVIREMEDPSVTQRGDKLTGTAGLTAFLKALDIGPFEFQDKVSLSQALSADRRCRPTCSTSASRPP